MRFGVFGGTFNPIHFGHLRAAEEVRQALELQSVMFVPSASPPLKSEELADIEFRFLMAAMAVATNEHFSISDMECRRPQRSYTVETARALRAEHPDAAIYFILGIDSFLELQHWREPEALTGLLEFAIIARPPMRFADLLDSGFIEADAGDLQGLDRGEFRMRTARLRGGRDAALVAVTALDISSTGIRRRVREGSSIKYLLPERVESFIMSNKLYAGDR